MSHDFYLPRTLTSGDQTFAEHELIRVSQYVVVLAEPGAGKSALLRNLANLLKVECVTANLFSHTGSDTKNSSLVIDAFDELAKIDQTGVYRLLAYAKRSDPKHVIISSRSSEWGTSSTKAFEDALGHKPLVVRLVEFNETEQRSIFDNITRENFLNFRSEVAKFDLESLLPNPQFLKLFADAYIESGKFFKDKKSIFSLAVDHLAREANRGIANKYNSVSIPDKVALGSEIFAKLLLSGSDGVTTSEASEQRIFPILNSLYSQEKSNIDILATRLFKPGTSPDYHQPAHKLVAEYCAACYLVKRIEDYQDTLNLPRCLPIIAPNSTVRDELRGLIGWMAALGNKDIQSTIICLDPYAVLANGDPSQLLQASRRELIRKLKETEVQDPYFRRGDYGRRFSIAGFFSKDIVVEIRPILALGNDGHLRELILELLLSAKEASLFESELHEILLSASEPLDSRMLASKCLLTIPNFNHLSNLSHLIEEASQASLEVAAGIISAAYTTPHNQQLTLEFLRSCTSLYLGGYDTYYPEIESHAFVKRLIQILPPEKIAWLLDEMALGLACTCGKKAYECKCRTGSSKIIGLLLDRYFSAIAPPFDPRRVWQWVNNLNFYYQKSEQRSPAVKAIRENVELRQGILKHVFVQLTDRDVIANTKIYKFDTQSHSGLALLSDDIRYLADLAFETDNAILWATCIPFHQKQSAKNILGPNQLRQHMRRQARENPEFMRAWVKTAHEAFVFEQSYGVPRASNRKAARRRKKQASIREKNARYITENWSQIAAGSNWKCLVHFAQLTLAQPEKIEEDFGDSTITSMALKNCLEFLKPLVPDLSKLAQLRCSSQASTAVKVLHAACFQIMAEKHTLDEVEKPLLRSLRANINTHYTAISEEKRTALKLEVDRIIFAQPGASEQFLREFVEPQLEIAECNHPDVWLLGGDAAFGKLKNRLAMDWLSRFENLKIETLEEIFNIAAEFGNRIELETIIMLRTSKLIALITKAPKNADLISKCKFWFIRAFYFIQDLDHVQWNWLQTDPEIIFSLSDQVSSYGHSGYSWPNLTGLKIKAILDANIDRWPSVYLPHHWGSESPKSERAYRYIRDLVWRFSSLDPEHAITPLVDLIADHRFYLLHKDLKSILTSQLRKRSLQNYQAPTPRQISDLLDFDSIVTVEGLRQSVIEELHEFQEAINGGEFNSGSRFFENGLHLDENRCTSIIAERLSLKLLHKGIIITPEHQLKNNKRSDFTASKIINGNRKLLVTEVKGQWHRELYTAAQEQLNERYSIHPDAEQQGIYLVLWFGADLQVGGLKNSKIQSGTELRKSLETLLPPELKSLIDIFVLDLSKSGKQ